MFRFAAAEPGTPVQKCPPQFLPTKSTPLFSTALTCIVYSAHLPGRGGGRECRGGGTEEEEEEEEGGGAEGGEGGEGGEGEGKGQVRTGGEGASGGEGGAGAGQQDLQQRWKSRTPTQEFTLLAGSQFARVAKGVDLRSTGGNSAWARTPQLT